MHDRIEEGKAILFEDKLSESFRNRKYRQRLNASR